MVLDENAEALRRSWCLFEARGALSARQTIPPRACLAAFAPLLASSSSSPPPLLFSFFSRSFKTASSRPSGATTKAAPAPGARSAPACKALCCSQVS